MKKHILYLFGLFFVFTSCEEVIDLDLPLSDPLPVVEGRITDQPGTKGLKLSWSIPYNSTDSFPVISGATIILFENGTAVESMVESSSRPGTYEFSHQAMVGSSYHIEIVTDDGVKLSSVAEEIKRIPEIDTIFSRYETGNPFLEDGYYVYFGLTDPAGLGDNYEWKFAFNSVFETGPFSLNLGDDRFVDGNVVPEILVNFEPLKVGDTVLVEQYTLTKENYEYWNQASTQTQQVGSIFDPPPAPVIGNMRNEDNPAKTVLGYFIVSGKRESTLIIQG